MAEIFLTRRAASLISESGGGVYIWSEPFGGGMLRVRAGLDQPDRVAFVEQPAIQGVRIFLSSEAMHHDRFIIRRRWLLPKRLWADTGVVVGSDV